jgi:superfamily II DNA or RNA helicase
MDIPLNELRQIDSLALWPHQLDAVATAQAYFDSKSKRGCLVQMPTGTGKTGVIAVLASLRSDEKAVLIVCPSAALVEQLTTQIRERFWARIGADAAWQPDSVMHVLPSGVDALAATLDASPNQRTVLIGTVQAIQQIEAEGSIAKLHGRVGTILFDEGHREPAPSWAAVIRGFEVPTVLFSATPFRGDLKIFDVDDEHIHFLGFQTAVGDGLIRGVDMDERPFPLGAELFAQTLIEWCDALVAENRFSMQNKVIVRCASEQSVKEVHDALLAKLAGRPDGVLAVHNNFRPRPDSTLTNVVPNDLAERPERFLVHQYMLIEGIDDPSCTMLALYEPFSNARMLVQQIGRLVRHPGPIGTEAPKALVLAPQGEGVGSDWSSFLAFDMASQKAGKPFLRNDGKVLDDLVNALPQLDYVAGKFRSRVEFGEDDVLNDLRFPSAAIVYKTTHSFNLEEFHEEIRAALAADDRHEALVGRASDGDCRYHITLRLTPSPFLSTLLFHSPSLEATIYAKKGNRLFFYDSAGLWIDEIEGLGPREDPKRFRSLLPEGTDNTVSFVNMKNTDLGPLALRSRSMSARSLERTGVSMGEHMNVVTRATGTIETTARKSVRRAVGFSRARLRDGQGALLNADQFADWSASINDELNAGSQSATMFGRYAAPADIPDDTTPLNILIDVIEVGGLFTSAHSEVAEIRTEDLCAKIEPETDPDAGGKFRFTLKVDDEEHIVHIDWSSKKRKYWLTSTTLGKIKSKENPKVSLTKRLNQRQPFRIIVGDQTHTYISGSFYKLDLDLTNPRGAAKLVLDLITPVAPLKDVKSEKGDLTDGHQTNWAADSLFALLDNALRPDRGPAIFGATFPDLVCDDLQDEVADFIGVNESLVDPNVTLVVAKWKAGNPGVGASDFYDICAQAVKNLAYMKSDGLPLPGSATRFDGKWRNSTKGKTATQTVDRRRHGRSSIAFRAAYQRLRTTPTTERVIWLVCSGGMLSFKKLKTEFGKTPIEPHVLQFYHLVVSTYSACQSVGVKLKIFCAD